MSPTPNDREVARGSDPEAGAGAGASHIDARGAQNIQIGENNVQIIYPGGGRTWTDGVAARPLAVSGKIDSVYRGLSAFSERDSAFFFGRDTAAYQVLERMARHLDGRGPLMVSGVSGAGKSSLVQAGVIPKVRAQGLPSVPGAATWPCVVFTPTSTPLRELAVRVGSVAGIDAAGLHQSLADDPERFVLTARQAALSGRDGAVDADGVGQRRVLVVVDQVEQIFTQCRNEDERRAFITALHSAAATTDHGNPAALVVLVVRADFEARCADYEQLAAAAQDRFLLTPMTPRQLRLAITEPAKVTGSGVDDDLVEVLLDEVSARGSSPGGGAGARAGVLPLLSHALDQAWRGRTGPSLSLADYERTGGIEGAVAASAQRAYDRLTPTQQQAARHVFIHLTATSSDGMNTATRLTRSDLTHTTTTSTVGDIEAVLESFATERLLTLAHETVEISHEVLLTAWPLLRDEWLAETQADRIVRTRFRAIATEWHTHRRDPSYLYSGSLLNDATHAATRAETDPTRHPPLTPAEKDFLTASTRAQHRANRRRRSFTASLIALVIALTSALGQAYANYIATHQRDTVISNQLINQSESAGTDPGASKQQALIAWRIHQSPNARYAMLNAAANPSIATFNSASPVDLVAFSPDGKTLASFNDHGAQLWDVATHRKIGNPLIINNDVFSMAFSPGGKILATGSDHGAQLWDVATHRKIGNPLIINNDVNSVAFSPNGKTLAICNFDGTARLWDVATHHQIGSPFTASVGSVAFSPDGKTFATGSDHGARLWDLATHHQIGRPFTASVGSVAFSPDGKTLVTASSDSNARLWDVATHRQIGSPLPVPSVTASVSPVAFSSDGKMFATGSDHGARLWDVATYRQIGAPLTSRSNNIISAAYSVAFSPDGKTLATGSNDQTARLWDVATDRQIGASLTSRSNNVISAAYSVAFSPDGKALVTGSNDGAAQMWDVATHRPIGNPFTSNGVYSVAFSPDGKILATGSEHTAELWEVATHRPIGNPLTINGAVYSVTFSPDGKTFVTGSSDGIVRLWDVATHRQIGTSLTSRSNNIVSVVYSVAFSPDGKTLATGNFDGTARLWDVATHRQIGSPFIGTNAIRSVAFSPDGKTLATGSNGGAAQLWDVATRRQIGPSLSSTDSVYSVAFSPDGKALATGSNDHTVQLWNMDHLNVPRYLCRQIGKSITPTVWKQYVSSGPAYQNVCP